MPCCLAKKVVKLLEENGFAETRVKGDHHQFKKNGHQFVITVPYSRLKDEIAIGTARSILRKAGLEEHFDYLIGRASQMKDKAMASSPVRIEIK